MELNMPTGRACKVAISFLLDWKLNLPSAEVSMPTPRTTMKTVKIIADAIGSVFVSKLSDIRRTAALEYVGVVFVVQALSPRAPCAQPRRRLARWRVARSAGTGSATAGH
jgi:hypothetical protein